MHRIARFLPNLPSFGVTMGLLGAAFALPAAAQDAQVVGDSPRCLDCVAVDNVLRIGSLDGEDALPGRPQSVVLDEQGRYWLLFGFNKLPIVVTPEGDVTTVGTLGDGPGEFRFPSAVVSIEDSTAIVDPRLARLTVLDANLEPARYVRFADPVPDQLMALDWPRAIVAAGAGRESDIVGWPLHVMDVSGEEARVVESMGQGDGTFRPGMSEFHLKHRVAAGPTGSYWATNVYGTYELVRWSAGGSMLERFVRSAPWFPAGTDQLVGNRNTPPKPALAGLHAYGSRMLMAVLRVPRSDWKQAWADTPELPGGTVAVPARILPTDAELFQTMIEIIDLEARRIDARLNLPGLPISVLSDGSVALYRETEQGVPLVVIVKPRLNADEQVP